MKLADVVAQLQLVLPKYTDYFSETIGITSITASGGVATVVASARHSLVTGDAVTISEVETETGISGVSQDGLVFTFTTSSDHDLTYGWEEHSTITLSGFTDNDWNATFNLVDVPNRRNFKVQSTNSIPILNGNEILHEIRNDGVNGRYSVTVSNTTTFTVSGDFIDGDYTGGTVKKGVRITGAVNIERAIDQYTEMDINEMWCFVVMNDPEVSKDRATFSDATATRGTGDDLRIRLIDGFTVTFIKNVSQDQMGVNAMDIVRHDLLLPLLKTLYGTRFPTGLTGNMDFKTVLTGSGISEYNRATLAYTYAFECVMDMISADSVEPEDTRAFRDIDYTETVNGTDTDNMTVTINLDEEPI